MANRGQKYYRTKKGLIARMYNNQTSHSTTRGQRPPEYTRKELHEWLISQVLFHELFDEYKQSNFQRNLVPSVNRKNNNTHYCFSNIELMTWEENDKLGTSDRISGADGLGRPIQQFLDGELIAEYPTIITAARALGKKRATNIHQVLSGNNIMAYGFVWQYKGESQEVRHRK